MAVRVTEHLQMDIVPTSAKKYNIITIRGKRKDILFSSDKQITNFTKQNSGKKVIQYLEKKIRHDDILELMRQDESSLGMSSDETEEYQTYKTSDKLKKTFPYKTLKQMWNGKNFKKFMK